MHASQNVVLLLAFSVISADSYKFLLYAPLFGRSHVTFLGKTSEALIEAGHEVTILIPVVEPKLGTKWTGSAKTILIPQDEGAKWAEREEEELIRRLWNSENPIAMISTFMQMASIWANMCNVMIHNETLLAELRAEQFDVGYSELMDTCGAGIFHILGINRTALALSVGAIEGCYQLTGAPSFASFVPGNMASYNEQMPFFTRMGNYLSYPMFDLIFYGISAPFNTLFNEKYPGFPNVWDLHQQSSLVFLNADPISDFPRPTSHKLIEIGGITVAKGHEKLNETWSAIMDLRPQTVFLSFGSVAKSYLMPPQYKNTIRETFRKFPDVTFIWKYEKPEDNIGEGIDNIIVTTWAPQNDLLHDRRLSLFITHCGGGSTIESNMAGVPRIVIPVMGDQQRNAQLVIRNKVGVVLEKDDLKETGKLEEALREVLGNTEYLKNAQKLASMLQRRPFTVKETFVRNMEFLAEFGPLRYLDQYGQQLSFVQYYLIDVFAFMISVVLVIIFVSYKITKFIVKKLCACYYATRTNTTANDDKNKKDE